MGFFFFFLGLLKAGCYRPDLTFKKFFLGDDRGIDFLFELDVLHQFAVENIRFVVHVHVVQDLILFLFGNPFAVDLTRSCGDQQTSFIHIGFDFGKLSEIYGLNSHPNPPSKYFLSLEI